MNYDVTITRKYVIVSEQNGKGIAEIPISGMEHVTVHIMPNVADDIVVFQCVDNVKHRLSNNGE